MDSKNVNKQEKLEFGVEFVGFGAPKLFRIIMIFEFGVDLVAIGVPNTLPKRKKRRRRGSPWIWKGFPSSVTFELTGSGKMELSV